MMEWQWNGTPLVCIHTNLSSIVIFRRLFWRLPFNLCNLHSKSDTPECSNSRYLTQFSWNSSLQTTESRKMKWEKGEKRKSPSLIYRSFAFWAIRLWNFQCLFVFGLVLFWCIFGDTHLRPSLCLSFSLSNSLSVAWNTTTLAFVVTTFLIFIHSYVRSLIHDIYMVTASIVQRRHFKFMNCDDTLDEPNRTQFVLNNPDGNIYLNVATHKLPHAFRTMCDALTHLWVIFGDIEHHFFLLSIVVWTNNRKK